MLITKPEITTRSKKDQIIVLFLLLIFYTFSSFLMVPRINALTVGELAPDFILPNIEGGTVKLSDLNKSIILLDFFATWCSPCLKELEQLKEIHLKYSDKVIIISIDVANENRDNLLNFKRDNEINWVIVNDRDNIMDDYGVYAIPTLLILGRDRTVLWAHTGLVDNKKLSEELDIALQQEKKVDDKPFLGKSTNGRILFDETHNEHMTILKDPTVLGMRADHTLWRLRQHLESLGYKVDRLTEGNISKETLEGYDVLVLSFPSQDLNCSIGVGGEPILSSDEIFSILQWIGNGHGLLIINDAMDEGMNNLNTLTGKIDFVFESDRVRDNVNNIGDSSNIVTHNSDIKNQILSDEIKKVRISSGCSITYSSDTISLLESSGDSWSDRNCNGEIDEGEIYGPHVISLAQEFGQGRIVAFGDINIIDENILNEYDNLWFVTEVFMWLSQKVEVTIDTQPRDISISVNGITFKATELPLKLRILQDAALNISVESLIYLDSKIERFRFIGWDDGKMSNTRIIHADSDAHYIAKYVKQYKLNVISLYGDPIGSDWYDEGVSALVSIQPADIISSGMRERFVEWAGAYEGIEAEFSIIMDAPKTVEAVWRIQYYLKVISKYGKTSGEEWYDNRMEAEFYLKPRIIKKYLGLVKITFIGWRGDLTANDPRATLIMDGPKTVEALWNSEIDSVFAFAFSTCLAMILFIFSTRIDLKRIMNN